MQLFTDRDRTEPRPAEYEEPIYEFLDRVDSPYWANVRDLLGNWYANLPRQVQPDLRNRFRSRHESQTVAAFWEMYLHEALSRAGFQVIWHPEVPETAKRPDFLVTAPSVGSFYVEATTVGALDEKTEHRRDRVLDTLNKMKSRNFFLEVDIESIGPRAFPASQKSRELSQWLETLDPDEVANAIEQEGLFNIPHQIWKQDGWQIEFRPIPIPPPRDRLVDRIVAMLSYVPAGMFSHREAIQTRLEAKAKRYGKLDLPFVVALLPYDRPGILLREVGEALLGGLGIPGTALPGRLHPGLWRGADGPRYRRVSAVLLSSGFGISEVARAGPAVWHNPWCYEPLDVSLPWPSIRFQEQTGHFKQVSDGVASHTLFGLPADWPGPEAWTLI